MHLDRTRLYVRSQYLCSSCCCWSSSIDIEEEKKKSYVLSLSSSTWYIKYSAAVGAQPRGLWRVIVYTGWGKQLSYGLHELFYAKISSTPFTCACVQALACAHSTPTRYVIRIGKRKPLNIETLLVRAPSTGHSQKGEPCLGARECYHRNKFLLCPAVAGVVCMFVCLR